MSSYESSCVQLHFDRLKRYYSLQNITELLKKEGIDCDNLIVCGEKGELPLHLFDDITFETRLPSQWYFSPIPKCLVSALKRAGSVLRFIILPKK